MKLNPTQINSYVSRNSINQTNSGSSSVSSNTEEKIKNEYSLEEDILGPSDQTISKSEESSKILSGKEQAILHGLFGTKKPSEMSFYGSTELRHIHKGQLMDISG